MLLSQKQWEGQTRLLKIGHMDCYAALPALETARPLLAHDTRERDVSLFLTELCSLHLHPDAESMDQIITNVLFGDGAVRVDVSATPQKGSLRVVGYHERMVPKTLEDMSWHLADSAFSMVLGKDVPALVGAIIADEVTALLSPHGLTLGDVSRYAIHPGGPRIIDAVQAALKLDGDAIAHSRAIMAAHGNMSSTTLPHIWERMLRDDTIGQEWIVSMGFGPGLTVALSLMEKIPA